jgi:hypothetical protein
MATYYWRPGSRLHHLDANVVGSHLEALRKQHKAESVGGLEAEVVVRAARAKSSPLHDAFLWDTAAAAHEHRLLQARQLLSNLRRVEEVAHKRHELRRTAPQLRMVDSPAFVHLRGESGYHTITEISKDPELLSQYLDGKVRELEQWVARHFHCTALVPLLEDIQLAIKRYLNAQQAA